MSRYVNINWKCYGRVVEKAVIGVSLVYFPSAAIRFEAPPCPLPNQPPCRYRCSCNTMSLMSFVYVIPLTRSKQLKPQELQSMYVFSLLSFYFISFALKLHYRAYDLALQTLLAT